MHDSDCGNFFNMTFVYFWPGLSVKLGKSTNVTSLTHIFFAPKARKAKKEERKKEKRERGKGQGKGKRQRDKKN